jgi:hypothetical protein
MPGRAAPEDHRQFAPARWLRVFGAFWWDFLVGDTPELFVGVLVILGAAALAVHQQAPRAVVIGVVPALTAVLLCISVLRHPGNRR